MGKETILAIIAGFALGLLAAFGAWNLSHPAVKREVATQPSSPTPVKTSFSLKIDKPEMDSILDGNQATVSGNVDIKAAVVVQSPAEEKVLETDSNGNFQTEVALEEGTNEIDITAYPKDQNLSEQTEERTVNYTKEEF